MFTYILFIYFEDEDNEWTVLNESSMKRTRMHRQKTFASKRTGKNAIEIENSLPYYPTASIIEEEEIYDIASFYEAISMHNSPTKTSEEEDMEEYSEKDQYVNLLQNPERFTGYSGPSAQRVWKCIQEENCFGAVSDVCREKRIFAR